MIICNNLFRYIDIYFSTEEIKKAIDDLAIDDVYDSVQASQHGNNNNSCPEEGPTAADTASQTNQTQASFARRK